MVALVERVTRVEETSKQAHKRFDSIEKIKEVSKVDKASLTRFALLIVAVVNAVLNLIGFKTISDDYVNDLVAVISVGYFIWTAWKNNYLSKKGKKQKEVLKKEGLAK
ncbi:phage holin [Heyndrickxia sp. NPDC080065]|uniref:phage holin n=1 Tax=Heyndrickxia sp. NPDC080065 TaxID=3390568 RepID=UPI003D026E71